MYIKSIIVFSERKTIEEEKDTERIGKILLLSFQRHLSDYQTGIFLRIY